MELTARVLEGKQKWRAKPADADLLRQVASLASLSLPPDAMTRWPLTLGFLIAGPVSGYLSDRFGARTFATGGMVVAAASFVLLELLPVNFAYWELAVILLTNGIGMGLFAAPNRAGIMNSLPPAQRGVGAGISATFQNAAMVLSIGIFFSLIILGLAGTLPVTLTHGLVAQGVPHADAARIAALPPVSIMFAALLGYNPVQTLLGHALTKLPAAHAAYLTGHKFFPALISAPFEHGLSIAFDFAIAACLVAAVASLLRGGKYVHGTEEGPQAASPAAPAETVPAGGVSAGGVSAGPVPAGAVPAGAVPAGAVSAGAASAGAVAAIAPAAVAASLANGERELAAAARATGSADHHRPSRTGTDGFDPH